MTTPNAMPAVLNDAVLPIREYIMPMPPQTIGERIGMDTESVFFFLKGQTPGGRFFRISDNDPLYL